MVIKQIILISLCAFFISAQASPDRTEFNKFFELGNEQYKQAQFAQALEYYHHAEQACTEFPQLFLNMGLAYAHSKKFNEAITYYNKAIALDQNYVKAHFYLGDVYKDTDQAAAAIEQYKKVLALDAQHSDALVQIAHSYSHLHRFDEAISFLRKALSTKPNDTSIMLDLANTLNMNNQSEHALILYRTLLAMLPHSTAIRYNIAYTLKKIGKIQEALPLYRAVIAQDPDHAEAHFGLGLAYLSAGNFQDGWAEYEWRWKRNDNQALWTSLKQPFWDGSDLTGKTILIHAEQGLGDTFQFLRYCKIAKQKGGKVIFATQSPLISILKLCPYIDQVVTLTSKLPHFDCHVPLVSMPYILKTTLETVPAEIPYLYAAPYLVEFWREEISHDKNFKVGICWQGNPNYSTHFLRVAVAAKSIQVNTFAPLFSVPGVSFYSLQRETGTDQLKTLNPHLKLRTFGDEFDNDNGRFMDTAALIKNLDLIITVDTSIAHLAAGLGAPVWLMLPNPPDWRWMLERTDSPWYPGMRLFRQAVPNDWDPLMRSIAKELEELVNKHAQARSR